VKAAMAAYETSLRPLRVARKRKSSERAEHGPSIVASLETANGALAWVGIALVFLVPGLLVLGAVVFASSRAGLFFGAFVLPVFGGLIAVVATAMAYGKTLHLQRRSESGTAVTPIADYFVFGPLLANSGRAAHVLEKSFAFRIERRLVGEEESERFVLVIAASGRALAGSANEGEMRSYGERLGGREVARAS